MAATSQLSLLPVCSLYIAAIVASRVNVLVTTYVAASIKGIVILVTYICEFDDYF